MTKLIIFIFMLSMNCSQKETINSVELSYRTRGLQKSLHITSDSIRVKINDKTYHYKTTEKHWQNILQSFEKIKLSEIASLKRPSTRSFHDGALMADLKVTTTLKGYNSVGFDHDMPPSALVKTVNAMKATLKNGEF